MLASAACVPAIVNNAGIGTGSLFDWNSIADYRAVMEVNFFAGVQVRPSTFCDVQRISYISFFRQVAHDLIIVSICSKWIEVVWRFLPLSLASRCCSTFGRCCSKPSAARRAS
jgi:hypothetical protein